MLDKLAQMMMATRWFSYRPGVVSGIGVGVEGLGLQKTQSNPLDGPYDFRNTVRGDLGPLAGGYVKMVQDVTDVNLKGSGSGLTGALALQALAEYQSGKGS